MRAQTVFENIEFQRGRDPKEVLGIGKVAQIKQWFEKWAPRVEYEIDDNFNIYVKEYLNLSDVNITSLPDNLEVERNLYLEDTNITSLPDDLKVGGYLDLRNTEITSLPDNLKVGGSLDIRNTLITSLPDDLEVKGEIWKDF